MLYALVACSVVSAMPLNAARNHKGSAVSGINANTTVADGAVIGDNSTVTSLGNTTTVDGASVDNSTVSDSSLANSTSSIIDPNAGLNSTTTTTNSTSTTTTKHGGKKAKGKAAKTTKNGAKKTAKGAKTHSKVKAAGKKGAAGGAAGGAAAGGVAAGGVAAGGVSGGSSTTTGSIGNTTVVDGVNATSTPAVAAKPKGKAARRASRVVRLARLTWSESD